MEALEQGFKSVVDALSAFVWDWEIPGTGLPWLAVLLVGTGLFLTLRMAFVQVWAVRHAFKVVAGHFDDPEHEGDISHFQALTTALSATIGIGNIAGVAMAIHWGGPGAVFWMWVTAAVGMCTKYVEVTLAMRHRDFDAEGNSSGGPQRYIEKGMGSRWKPLAIFFAACAMLSSFGAGNMNQINTLAQAVYDTTGIPDFVTGAICAVLVGAVIIGGIRRIGRVTSVLVPVMALVYVLGSLALLAMHADRLPGAFGHIFQEAFNPTSGVAGTAAGVWSLTLLWGVKRGLFSNEAGQGSAPIAHAAAKTDEPVREGVVALLGPFIDTLVICTMTALVVLVSGIWNEQVPETHSLAQKDLKVMTWEEGTPLTLASFGELAGRGQAPARIEEAGYEGDWSDGETEDAEVESVELVIRNGRELLLRREDGSTRMAVLVKHEAPVLLDGEDEGVFEADGTRCAERVLEVEGGSIVAGADNLELRARMMKNGQALTAASFRWGLGPLGSAIVTLTVILFALSTAISWSYYGDRCAEYLFGIRGVHVYKLVFVAFVYLGAVLQLQTVWDFGDVALGLMTLPNLVGILFLSGQVRRMQDEYFSRKHDEVR